MRAIEVLEQIVEQNNRIEAKLDLLIAETQDSKKIQNDQLEELKRGRLPQ